MIKYVKYYIHDHVNVINIVIYILNTLIRVMVITLILKEERHKNMHFYLRH